MSNHSNAVPGQYPEFAGLVQHKLWPAVKGRLQEKDFKALISKPEAPWSKPAPNLYRERKNAWRAR